MELKDRTLDVGDHVVFIDSRRRRLNALVQAVHGDVRLAQSEYYPGGECVLVPCINIIVISPDPERHDQYGRQIEHHTSVCWHEQQTPVVGMCWHWPDEHVEVDESNIATKR